MYRDIFLVIELGLDKHYPFFFLHVVKNISTFMWNSLGFFHLVIYISLEIRLFIFHIFVFIVSSELSTNQRASSWHATTLKITPSLIGQGATKQN